MTTPAAAAAMATVIVELRNRSRMLVSLVVRCLLQWIVVAKSRCVVVSERVRTFSLREGLIFQTCVAHDRREADISFDAERLVIDPILFVALFGEFLLHGPG